MANFINNKHSFNLYNSSENRFVFQKYNLNHMFNLRRWHESNQITIFHIELKLPRITVTITKNKTSLISIKKSTASKGRITQIFETLAELVLERTGRRKSGCMGEKWPGVWKEFWEVDRGWNDSGVLGRLRRVERGFERVFWIVTRLGSLREGFRRGGEGEGRDVKNWLLLNPRTGVVSAVWNSSSR